MPTSEFSSTPDGQVLRRAFEALIAVLNERGVRYAIIGGIAMMQHVRARATEDIDALLIVPQIAMPGLFEALEERGFSVNTTENIRQFRDEGMTAISFGGVAVDLLRPVIPAYAHVLDRAVSAIVEGQRVSLASPEGLIVTKLLAMRLRDEADIADLVSTYAGKLDLQFIRAELESFTTRDDPRRARLDDLVRSAPSA